jgi:hypothetical protein
VDWIGETGTGLELVPILGLGAAACSIDIVDLMRGDSYIRAIKKAPRDLVLLAV